MTAPREAIRVEDGRLMVEDCAAGELARTHGTPLFVYSEARLRENYHAIHGAFATRWPAPVRILYAVKANLALALRRVLAREGAGADVFGAGELHAALTTGGDGVVALNGSLKPPELLRGAIAAGARINVDVVEEMAAIEAIARELGIGAQVGVRAKPDYRELEAYESVPSPYRDGRRIGLGTWILDNKWGLTVEEAVEAVRLAQRSDHLTLVGVHSHVGRHYAQQGAFAAAVPGLVRWVAAVRDATGWAPSALDLGGGFADRRDPLFRVGGDAPAHRPEPIETVAEGVTAALRAALSDAGLPTPALELEPGRFLLSSAGLLLAAVGPIKRQGAYGTWVNVDASVAHFPGPELFESRHEVLLVDRADAPRTTERCAIVGPSCWEDLLAYDQPLPALGTGDVVAFLDAGAYGESFGGNSNAIGRPASVLVSGGEAEEIRRRETVQDVFARDRVPERLWAARRDGGGP